MSPIISLTSDFGLTDAYVGAMKGAILGINPEAVVVDISHSIEPQNVSQAAFILSTACEAFPDGAIHVVVVDPGVGTERRGIVLKTPRATFVAPDNGVLTYVVRAYAPDGSMLPVTPTAPGTYLEAVNLTNQKYWRSPVSATFHGRDIFAPVAAHLSLGVALHDLGEPVPSLEMLPVASPERKPDGTVVGRVIHIDHFGNLVVNIACERLTGKPWKTIVEVGQRRIEGLSQTYGQAPGLLALTGSTGYLEIAFNGGSAASFLGVRVGDEVLVRQPT